MVPVIFFEKNDPFLTYEPPKVSIFLALVTGLVLTKLMLLEPIFQKSQNMHMDHLKYVKLLYIYLKEGCKVSVPNSDTKRVNGAITGVADSANN